MNSLVEYMFFALPVVAYDRLWPPRDGSRVIDCESLRRPARSRRPPRSTHRRSPTQARHSRLRSRGRVAAGRVDIQVPAQAAGKALPCRGPEHSVE